MPFECGVDDGQGGFNRQISIDDLDVQLNPICFATCNDCGQVGLDELYESSLNVYPNPTHGLISIQSNSATQENISITDTTGRIVYSSTLSGNFNSIDVSHLSGGVYYLTIGDNKSLRVIKY